MAEIGSAFLSIIPSARNFGRTLESDVSGQVNGVGKKVGTGFGKAFAVAAGAIAAVGVGSILKESIGLASDLEETGTKITAIFGKAGADVQSFADAGAKALGQSRGDVLNAAASFGTFGKAAGLSGKDLADFSTGFVSLSTDLASFSNSTPEAAVEAIGAALRGEAEPIRSFGVLLDDATLRNEALKLGLISTTKDALTPQQKVLAAQAAIYKQTSDAQGDFARTSGGLANQQRILSAQFTDLKARLGSVLLPVVTRAVTYFNSNVIPAVTKVGDAFAYLFGGGEEGARGFAEIIDNAFGNTGRFIGPVTKITEAFQTAFAAAVQVRSEIAQRLAPAFSALAGFISRNPELVRNFAIALGVLVGAISAVTIATTAFSIALNSTGIPLVIIGIAALAAGLIYAYQHSEGFRTAVQSLATTFQTSVLPALQSMWAYFQTNIIPVFVAVGAVIRDQVLPIIRSFALFVIGTLIPAIVRIATAVGSNLAPIFKQLVATFKSDVLPTIQLVLAKFKEYQPVIQTVIGVVVKVIGKYLELAAAILGKVLPPLIRFAGFLISNVVPSVIATIDVGARIIATAIEIGKAFLDAVRDVAKFASGVKDKVAEAISYVRGIPGKVTAAIGNLGSLLYNAGAELVQGLINGITSKISALQGKLSELGGKIKGFLPGSPVKEGPLKSWNDGKGGVSAAGARLMDGLAKGIADGGPKVADKMREALEKVVEQFESKRDRIKSVLDGFKSDFASLSSSVSNAFTGNLFESETASDFVNSLSSKFNKLQDFQAAFKKLRGYGVSPAFLSQLFASGNGALILDLAAGPKSQASMAESLFGGVGLLGQELGGQVAQADLGPRIDRQTALQAAANRELREVKNELKKLAKDIGKELNGAVKHGQRSAA